MSTSEMVKGLELGMYSQQLSLFFLAFSKMCLGMVSLWQDEGISVFRKSVCKEERESAVAICFSF